MNRILKHRHIALLLTALLTVAALAGCNPPGSDNNQAQGEKSFILEITGASGEKITMEIDTTEETVGEALIAQGLIIGDETGFGILVTHVNGERADYNEDGAYWAFYINGEMAMVGVSEALVVPGQTYGFVYKEA